MFLQFHIYVYIHSIHYTPLREGVEYYWPTDTDEETEERGWETHLDSYRTRYRGPWPLPVALPTGPP